MLEVLIDSLIIHSHDAWKLTANCKECTMNSQRMKQRWSYLLTESFSFMQHSDKHQFISIMLFAWSELTSALRHWPSRSCMALLSSSSHTWTKRHRMQVHNELLQTSVQAAGRIQDRKMEHLSQTRAWCSHYLGFRFWLGMKSISWKDHHPTQIQQQRFIRGMQCTSKMRIHPLAASTVRTVAANNLSRSR